VRNRKFIPPQMESEGAIEMMAMQN
jgi:hypothetical protein